MKYKTKSGKALGNQQTTSELAKRFSESARKFDPFILGFFISIFDFLIGCYAYISRSFLRVNLGERTFGVFVLIPLYFMIPFIFVIQVWYKSINDYLIQRGWGFFETIYIFIANSNTGNMINYLTLYRLDDKFPILNISVYLLFFITLIITFGHLIDIYTRRIRKHSIHSYYRGDSLLFSWLDEKKIGWMTINKLTIWMIIEPIFIFSIAWFLGEFFELTQVATVLKVSAICLLIEEYRVFSENRNFELDMMDGQLDAEYAKKVQNKYADVLERQNEKNGNSKIYKAVLADENSISIEQYKSSSNNDTGFSAKIE